MLSKKEIREQQRAAEAKGKIIADARIKAAKDLQGRAEEAAEARYKELRAENDLLAQKASRVHAAALDIEEARKKDVAQEAAQIHAAALDIEKARKKDARAEDAAALLDAEAHATEQIVAERVRQEVSICVISLKQIRRTG